MIKLSTGAHIEVRNNSTYTPIGMEPNTYLVLEADDEFAKIKCVSFIQVEDVGDQIMCVRKAQEIWIAQFHSAKFQAIKFKV